MSGIGSASRHVHLDALRGLASLLVVIGHARGFILVDYASSGSRSLAGMAVYFVTGLGHSAVLAFFALSGFLVGGAALRAILAGTWSARRYFVARLSRLWTVVIPALALTFVVDLAGKAAAGHAGYDGQYWSILASGPQPDAPSSLSFSTFVANALFLQTIAAPVFGSNGPLWSLANEFWYYVAVPLAAFGLMGRGSPSRRVISIAVALCLAMALPFELVVLGMPWVAGAAARVFFDDEVAGGAFCHPVCIGGLACLLVAVCAYVSLHGEGSVISDLAQGLLWAALLPGLARLGVGCGAMGRIYERFAAMLSEISFTLYATHFPILSFICFTLLTPRKFLPGAEAFGAGAGLLVVAISVAAANWWLFERKTPLVRRALSRALGIDAKRMGGAGRGAGEAGSA